LTPGSHDFLPLNLGLAVTFLVAMAVMREHPLPTPNDTDGDKRRPLLLLIPTVPFTKDDLDTAAVSCDTDALLATAITTDRRSNTTVLVFFFLVLVLVLVLLLLVAKLEQKKLPSSRKAKQGNWSFALRRPTNNTLLLSKTLVGMGGLIGRQGTNWWSARFISFGPINGLVDGPLGAAGNLARRVG